MAVLWLDITKLSHIGKTNNEQAVYLQLYIYIYNYQKQVEIHLRGFHLPVNGKVHNKPKGCT